MQIKPLQIAPPTALDEKTKARVAKVRNVLEQVNGYAMGHTYTTNADLVAVVARVENQLAALGLPKKARAGAVYIAVSGGRVANSYKYPRAATRATLTRRASGWWLTSVSATTINRDAPRPILMLTSEQDAIAVAELRKGYSINPWDTPNYGSYATNPTE